MAPPRFNFNLILWLLSAGLLLRLLLAYVILPSSGLVGDLGAYTNWAITLVNVGPGEFYDSAGFADYPPGYLYVLWLIGTISKGIVSITGADIGTVVTHLLKIPPIFLDIFSGFMLYATARNWCTDKPRAERVALTAAAIYLFNPVTWYDSAIWGQTDAAGACVILMALVSLTRWPSEVTASVAALACLIKPQFGVILTPLVGIVLLKRHILPQKQIPATDLVEKALPDRSNGALRLLCSSIVGLLVFYALITPFNLSLHAFIERMTATAQLYHFLSVNAYNPWAFVGSGDTQALVFGSIGAWSRDDIPLIGSLKGVEIGSTLLLLGILAGIARLLWRADRWSIASVGVFLSMCFFILPTRVHERYIFSAFAFLPLLAAFDRKWLWATLALTFASFINLHGVLTVEFHGTPNVISLPLGEFCRSPTAIITSTVLHTAVFLFSIWKLWPDTVFSAASKPNSAASRAPFADTADVEHFNSVERR